VSVDPQPVSPAAAAADKDKAEVHEDTHDTSSANRTLTEAHAANDTVMSMANVSTAVTLPAPFIRNNRRLIICHTYLCIAYSVYTMQDNRRIN
jgi:hypothetical protein